MPKGMPTNINWITLVAASTGLFAWLFPSIPSGVREDILILAFVVYLAVVPVVHSFVNHSGGLSLGDFHVDAPDPQRGAHSDIPTYQPNSTTRKDS